MFKCQKCYKVSDYVVKPLVKVVKSRKKVYVNVIKKNYRTYDKISTGWEIVKEVKLCEECFNE